MTDPADPNKDKGIQDYARYSTLGLQFGLTFLALGAAGYFVDQWLGTQPWFLIAGIFLGAFGAFWNLVREVNRGEKLDKDSKDSKK